MRGQDTVVSVGCRGRFGMSRAAVGDVTDEILWAEIEGQTNEVSVIMGVCYWPPSQDDNKLFFKEPRDTAE